MLRWNHVTSRAYNTHTHTLSLSLHQTPSFEAHVRISVCSLVSFDMFGRWRECVCVCVSMHVNRETWNSEQHTWELSLNMLRLCTPKLTSNQTVSSLQLQFGRKHRGLTYIFTSILSFQLSISNSVSLDTFADEFHSNSWLWHRIYPPMPMVSIYRFNYTYISAMLSAFR